MTKDQQETLTLVIASEKEIIMCYLPEYKDDSVQHTKEDYLKLLNGVFDFLVETEDYIKSCEIIDT